MFTVCCATQPNVGVHDSRNHVEVVSMQYNTLGEMLRKKRNDLGIGHRKMAAMVGLPPTVFFEIETGLRYPPDLSHLERWADVLSLTKKERHLMFDLAGKRRGRIAPDLPDYIKPRQYVTDALRIARDVGATKKDWEKFTAFVELSKAAET